MKYFVFANNQYGYDEELGEFEDFEEAKRYAQKLSREAWRAWHRFSIPHNNAYEVYAKSQDPDIDKPLYRIY